MKLFIKNLRFRNKQAHILFVPYLAMTYCGDSSNSKRLQRIGLTDVYGRATLIHSINTQNFDILFYIKNQCEEDSDLIFSFQTALKSASQVNLESFQTIDEILMCTTLFCQYTAYQGIL